MKILFVSDFLSSIHEYRFLLKMSEKYKIFVFSFEEIQPPERIRNLKCIKVFHLPVKENLFDKNDNFISKTIKTIKIKINFILKYYYLRHLIREVKPDILHAGWVQNSGYLSALTNYHPFLLMPWGCDINTRPFINKRQMQITKYTLRKADEITCDCEDLKNKIIDMSGFDKDRIIVFPWGAELDIFNPENRDDDLKKKLGWQDNKIVIITRSFEKIYGIDYLLNAIPKVVKNVPEARFIFCGDGPDKEILAKIADDLSIMDCIKFQGRVNSSELPHYLNAADLYVSTSLSDGSSVSLLEAMACSKPVVVSDVPSNLEWIVEGKGGYVVPRKDSVILAERITALLKNDDLRKKMGQFNLQIALDRADWDKNFDKLVTMYERLSR